MNGHLTLVRSVRSSRVVKTYYYTQLQQYFYNFHFNGISYFENYTSKEGNTVDVPSLLNVKLNQVSALITCSE